MIEIELWLGQFLWRYVSQLADDLLSMSTHAGRTHEERVKHRLFNLTWPKTPLDKNLNLLPAFNLNYTLKALSLAHAVLYAQNSIYKFGKIKFCPHHYTPSLQTYGLVSCKSNYSIQDLWKSQPTATVTLLKVNLRQNSSPPVSLWNKKKYMLLSNNDGLLNVRSTEWHQQVWGISRRNVIPLSIRTHHEH